jgi:CBS domain-containing protein
MMRTEFTRVAPEVPVTLALPLMLESDLGALLVVSRDRLVGIVTERDLLRAVAALVPGEPGRAAPTPAAAERPVRRA